MPYICNNDCESWGKLGLETGRQEPVWLLIGVHYDDKQTAYEGSEFESFVKTAKSDNTGTIEYTNCAEEPTHGQPKLSRGFVYS